MTHNNKDVGPLMPVEAIATDSEVCDDVYYLSPSVGNGEGAADRIFDIDIEGPLAVFESSDLEPLAEVWRIEDAVDAGNDFCTDNDDLLAGIEDVDVDVIGPEELTGDYF